LESDLDTWLESHPGWEAVPREVEDEDDDDDDDENSKDTNTNDNKGGEVKPESSEAGATQ
jgi:hypothetical protein